jgi:DNA repair exonuclease SbcCD ATPase subunit
MKRFSLMFAVCLLGATAYAQQASSQQSLGDVARANRARKHASPSAVKLDDDTTPRNSTPSSSSESETAKKTSDDKAADAKDSDKEAPKKDAAEAQKQKNAELKKQIDAQKKEIATLQRELDIAQREARLRAAAFYGDAGTMLRDQTKFAEDTRKEQDEINGKKQALDAAQQKLEDLQEQARKAGMPSE